MSDERGRGERTYTHAELDRAVASLHSVGGIYEQVAQVVDRHERPRCTGEETGARKPWES